MPTNADATEPVILSGRYRLERPLAAGGMGAVHIALDERLGRRVAVKLLKGELASDPDAVERFRREAHAAAKVSHPNIAQVFDHGHDGGHHFIVMELVEGTDLARIIEDRGPLTPSESVGIASQICAALAVAHRAGIVHRDIKPANVIVTPRGHVKVTDFGIARTLGDNTLTQLGTVLGTVKYLSPEQVRGEPAVPASDLYALGVVLFQMLTGTVPFTAEEPVAIAVRHLNEQVPAPSTLVAGLPPALDRVVERATAKEVDRRFADADEMAAALAQALASPRGTAPLPTYPPGSGQVTPSPATPRWRLPWLAGAAALAAAVVLAVVALQLTGDDRTPTSAAPDTTRTPSHSPSHKASTSARPSPSPTPTPTTEPETGPVVPPGIVGWNKKDAEETLRSSGYDVKTVDLHSGGPKDTVVATLPAPGQPVTPGQTVVVMASKGEPADGSSYRVPSGFVGADAHDVEEQLKEQEIEAAKVPVDSAQPKDVVLGTWPAAGGSTQGGQVVLLVSSGHAPH